MTARPPFAGLMETVCSVCGQSAPVPDAGAALCAVCGARQTMTEPGAATHPPTHALPAGEWEIRHRNQRHFGVCLLLGLLTLGLYFIYWHFAVFREVAEREGRSYAWGLLAGDLAVFAATAFYALARYQGPVDEAVLRTDPWFGAGILVSQALWAAFLVVETQRLNRGLLASGSNLPVPVYPLPAVIVALTLVNLFTDSRVVDAIGVVLMLALFYLLHNGINRFWRHRGTMPAATSAATQTTA